MSRTFWGRSLVAVSVLATGALPMCAIGFAEEQASVQPLQERTIQGEVVDPAAYLKGGRHGTDATEETYQAVDGGQTLAILESGTGNLYLLLAEQPGEDPNELAYDYANQQVTAKGQVYERTGFRGMVVTSIEPLAPATGPGATTKPGVAPTPTSPSATPSVAPKRSAP